MLKPMFVAECRDALEALARETGDGGPALLVGAPWLDGGKLYNAVLLLDAGRIVTARYKVDLPNYGVFDEKRVFVAGPPPGPIDVRGVRLGVPICEDIWTADVVECLAETGGEILLVPNGSPFELGKADVRTQLAVARVVESGLPLVYLNQLGGQDELVFDGASFVLNADRSLVLQLPAWEEAVVTTRWTRGADGWSCAPGPRVRQPEGVESLYCALTTGLRDYVVKNGFPGVILGLSGGIDSAISAAVAVDALGPDRVRCVMMPSPYTSAHSLEDAAAAAEMMGVRYSTIDIGPAMQAFAGMLAEPFAGTEPRHHRGEHPGALARHHPDGAVQQVRPHGAVDRQQVGDVGRLRHALRRHVRRLLGAEGRLQDERVRAVDLAQRPPPGRRPGP